MNDGAAFSLWAVIGILLMSALVAFGMWGCPTYNVYNARMQGEAELQRAQQNRQIAVQEAQAKMEAAKMLAQAEVERAKGVAAANKIIADGLKGNDEYLHYLWITDVANNQKGNTVIYVPTEAQIPVMEAGKR